MVATISGARVATSFQLTSGVRPLPPALADGCFGPAGVGTATTFLDLAGGRTLIGKSPGLTRGFSGASR
jgi:hypothetical protein